MLPSRPGGIHGWPSRKSRRGPAAIIAASRPQHNAIAEFCRDADIYRVLVILSLRGRLFATDSYEMVEDAKEYGWDHRFNLAFVDTNGASVDDVRLTETVAVNRAYSVRAFTDEAEAIDWLLDSRS